jgi:hypothetical protein
MTEKQREEIRAERYVTPKYAEIQAAADAAWAAYTTAIQAVMVAPVDWDAHNMALLWQDAERCAAVVAARLIEGAQRAQGGDSPKESEVRA